MSSYVPLNLPAFSGTPNYANSVTWLSQTASAIASASQSFMTSLTDLGNIDFSQVGDLPTFTSPVLLGTLTGVNDRPVRPSIQVANINGLLNQLAQITLPEAPITEFTYTDPGYASILRDPLLQKLLLDLVNGGYGIEANDEEALWNRMRDREAQALQSQIEEIKRQASTSSFPVPQGALAAQIAKATQDYTNKLSSANRDIALKRADMYVENRRFTIEKVLQSEDQSIGLYNAIQTRALNAAQIEISMAIALFDAGIRLFQGQIDSVMKQIEAPLLANQQTLDLYRADVAAYAAYVNAIATTADLDIRNSRNILDRDIATNAARTEKVRFKLQQLATTTELRRDIYKYGADFFRTALGSAMNNINGLAVQSSEV